MATLNLRRDADVRIYDGTTPTPFYVRVTFLEPPTIPLREPRPAVTLIAGGGRAEAGNLAQIVPDETTIFEPIPFTMRVAMDNDSLDVLDAFGNPRGLGTWTVFGDTWTAVPKASLGTRKNSLGTAIATPGPGDQVLLDGMFNVEVLHGVPPGGTGAARLTRLIGVTAQVINQAIEDPQVFVDFECQVNGGIDSTGSAFTSGNEST